MRHYESDEDAYMKPNVLLTSAAMLSILLCTFHLTDDIVHGWEPGTLRNLYALPIFVVWLYGTLLLRDRPSGYIIMLLGSLVSLGIPVIHMSGKVSASPAGSPTPADIISLSGRSSCLA